MTCGALFLQLSNIWSCSKINPGYPRYILYRYMIYGHYPKINTSYRGTPGTTYQYQICGYFSKINTSYQGTLGTTYKYLICSHFPKINTSYQGTPLYLQASTKSKNKNINNIDNNNCLSIDLPPQVKRR